MQNYITRSLRLELALRKYHSLLFPCTCSLYSRPSAGLGSCHSVCQLSPLSRSGSLSLCVGITSPSLAWLAGPCLDSLKFFLMSDSSGYYLSLVALACLDLWTSIPAYPADNKSSASSSWLIWCASTLRSNTSRHISTNVPLLHLKNIAVCSSLESKTMRSCLRLHPSVHRSSYSPAV